ncbi:MAG: hypothetical protein AB7G13_04320 [Lautropia sp.]
MANTDREARVSEYRTWGLGRRAEPLEIYDAAKFPFIARVSEHLGLRLLEIRGEGEPAQIALGEARDPNDPDAVSRRVTPFFSSLESLDYFCRINLQSYLAVDSKAAPRRWFWQEAARAKARSGGGGSIVNEASVAIGRHSFGH